MTEKLRKVFLGGPFRSTGVHHGRGGWQQKAEDIYNDMKNYEEPFPESSLCKINSPPFLETTEILISMIGF